MAHTSYPPIRMGITFLAMGKRVSCIRSIIGDVKILQAEPEDEMLHGREPGVGILFRHREEIGTERFDVQGRIQEEIDGLHGTARGPKPQDEWFIIYPYDAERAYLAVGEEVILERYPGFSDADMDDGMAVHLVEEIDPREDDDDDAQEIGAEEEAHDRDRDSEAGCYGIPFFSSLESALKCPGEWSHKIRSYRRRNSR